jgi:hypothetical protein
MVNTNPNEFFDFDYFKIPLRMEYPKMDNKILLSELESCKHFQAIVMRAIDSPPRKTVEICKKSTSIAKYQYFDIRFHL